MIFALFAFNSVKSFHFTTRLNYCYHMTLCLRFANIEYSRLYDLFNGMPHLQYQLALNVSYLIRSRSRVFGWYHFNLNNVFAPLIAFKTREPYPGFNRHNSHIYRQLEQSPRVLEKVDEDPFKIEEMNKCDSVASCKKSMCESTEHDFKHFNKHYDIIKVYYKLVMQAKYYELTGQKENIDFFESSCFDKDYKGEKDVVYDSRNLSEGALINLHEQNSQTTNMLLSMYPIYDVPRAEDFDDAEENALGSKIIDDVVDSSSIPVPENNLNQDSDKVYMEPVFNKQGDIVKMVETVF